MRNNIIFFMILLVLSVSSCNMPSSKITPLSPETGKEFLWDLSAGEITQKILPSGAEGTLSAGTPTPQLYQAIDFEAAFSNAASVTDRASSANQPMNHSGNDRAEWLYFSPAEFSSDYAETLYAVFRNTGERTWSEDYYLDFYAGANPSAKGEIPLGKTAAPGEEASFAIPLQNGNASWKACWHLMDPSGEGIYDFCYNRGSGINLPTEKSAEEKGSEGEQSGVFYAFVKTKGSAPARYSSDTLSADLVSTAPATGHTFKAYDHYEELSATFRNNGSETWDASYSLVFYSGYNWMHANSFSLPGNVSSGETVTITMPMEIFEDNDRWETCWYLSTPDGKNLSDFCFKYYTKS